MILFYIFCAFLFACGVFSMLNAAEFDDPAQKGIDTDPNKDTT